MGARHRRRLLDMDGRSVEGAVLHTLKRILGSNRGSLAVVKSKDVARLMGVEARAPDLSVICSVLRRARRVGEWVMVEEWRGRATRFVYARPPLAARLRRAVNPSVC